MFHLTTALNLRILHHTPFQQNKSKINPPLASKRKRRRAKNTRVASHSQRKSPRRRKIKRALYRFERGGDTFRPFCRPARHYRAYVVVVVSRATVSWKRRKSSTLGGHWKRSRQSQSGRPLYVYFGQFNAIGWTIDRVGQRKNADERVLYANERGRAFRRFQMWGGRGGERSGRVIIASCNIRVEELELCADR